MKNDLSVVTESALARAAKLLVEKMEMFDKARRSGGKDIPTINEVFEKLKGDFEKRGIRVLKDGEDSLDFSKIA